jgi:hypothetical protein
MNLEAPESATEDRTEPPIPLLNSPAPGCRWGDPLQPCSEVPLPGRRFCEDHAAELDRIKGLPNRDVTDNAREMLDYWERKADAA